MDIYYGLYSQGEGWLHETLDSITLIFHLLLIMSNLINFPVEFPSFPFGIDRVSRAVIP